jgi:N,N'-diacetyllegionaminate synthase
MANIPYLKRTLGLPVGFSSPGLNHDLDIIAISLGANVIEKRLTLNRGSKGHHHVLSLEPNEIKPWVEKIRFAEAALGKEEIVPSESDIEESKKYYRSICIKKAVKKGEKFTLQNLDAKRPGTGISARYLDIFLGRIADRDISEDTLLTWEDL